MSRSTPVIATDATRGATRGCEPVADVEASVAYRPPFAWQQLLDFLALRTIRGVEHVQDGAYRRTVRVEVERDAAPVPPGRPSGCRVGWIEVRNDADRHRLSVRVSSTLAGSIDRVLGGVRRVFDTEVEPAEVGAALGALASACPGLRLPGAFDGFELAVRAVLGQQISVKAAHTLAGRLAAAFGEPLDTPWVDLAFLFPRAHRLAVVAPEEIAALGIVGARSRTIVALARAVADGLCLEPQADPPATIAALRGLPGIGDWTAQYIAMRALGGTDAFPAGDLGVRRALGDVSAAAAIVAAERWRPWRGYAVIHLWHAAPPTGRAGRE